MSASYLACRTDRDDLPEQVLPPGVYVSGGVLQNDEHHMAATDDVSDIYCSCGLDFPCGSVDQIMRDFGPRFGVKP